MAGWVTTKKKKKLPTFSVGDELVGFESLTEGQQDVAQQFRDALTKALAGMGERFEYEPTIQGALKGYDPYAGEVGGATKTALLRALSGEFPEEYFQASIAGPAREQFYTETAPAIREEFAGPGTYWGTARAGEVTGEAGKMERNLAAIRGDLGYKAQLMALNAVGTSLEAQQNAQRLAQQEYLNRLAIAFKDYTRTHPEMTDALQAALSYLGIPMLATYQPYEEGKSRGNSLSWALSQG